MRRCGDFWQIRETRFVTDDATLAHFAAKAIGVGIEEVARTSNTRARGRLLRTRCLAIWLVRHHANVPRSWPDIARVLWYKSHSTIFSEAYKPAHRWPAKAPPGSPAFLLSERFRIVLLNRPNLTPPELVNPDEAFDCLERSFDASTEAYEWTGNTLARASA